MHFISIATIPKRLIFILSFPDIANSVGPLSAVSKTPFKLHFVGANRGPRLDV